MTWSASLSATEASPGFWISSDGYIVGRRAGHTSLVGWETVAACNNAILLPDDLEAINEEVPRNVYMASLSAQRIHERGIPQVKTIP